MKTILVTGATGRQGGAVTKHLLERGYKVRAMTRHPEGSTAQKLQESGVEVVRCDMEDREQLLMAMNGVYGVFSLQNFWEKGVEHDGEVRQGKNVADIAKKVGVQHFIFSSVVDCEKAPELKHWTSKLEVERYIDQLELPRTFLRTVFFMENFIMSKASKLTVPVLRGALRKESKLHMLAVEDIGFFAAEIFDHPDKYLGKKVDIAGDALTAEEMKQAIIEEIGMKPPSFKMPSFIFKLLNAEMARQFKWNDQVGWKVDLEEVKAIHPELKDFRAWLRENKNQLLEL